jgi:hypothetical protein
MKRVTSFLLLAGVSLIVFNSDAWAIELNCNESAVISGSAQSATPAASKFECEGICSIQNFNA